MSKFECNLVADLLPIFLDGKASEETSELINKHIGSCPECRDMYAAMSADVSMKKEPVEKGKRRLKPLVKVVIGFVCYMVIMVLLLVIFTIIHIEGV